MDLSQALKAGIVPKTANPVDIVLIAHKEGLQDLLQKQIRLHHAIIKNNHNPDDVRKSFKLTCDFSEMELSSMDVDLKLWNSSRTNIDSKNETFTDTISSLYDGELYNQPSVGILASLRRKKIYKPVNDKTVSNCYKCGDGFDSYISWVRSGKHHCRACGRIFCSNCSKWKEIIPDELISYIETEGWIIPGKPSRVCQECKDTIINYRRITPIVKYFEIVAYPIDSCVKASTLSKDWREAVRFYLSNVRDIQYCLPCSKLSARDISALNSNIKTIQGHSKWMLQALKMGPITIDGERIKMCHDMMCDSNCTKHLSPFDALIILNNSIYNIEVRLLALQILEKDRLLRSSPEFILGNTSLTSSELLIDNKPSFSRDIALFLPIEDLSVQEFVLRCPDLFLDFFWLSRINCGSATDIFRNKLLLANHNEANYVQESLRLISILNENYDDPCKLSQQLQTLQVPFIGPFGIIEKFDSDIIVKQSVTRPIIVRYYTKISPNNPPEKRAFLYKREDIRKDAHIVALIRIMYYLCSDIFSNKSPDVSSTTNKSSPIDISSASEDVQSWFTRNSPISFSPSGSSYSSPELFTLSNFDSSRIFFGSSDNLDLDQSKKPDSGYLVTYQVTPISTDGGFVEIVPYATTLYDILNEGSISNYLYNPDEGGDVGIIGSNYLNSLAFWTVISFILGVGDRHLENIMIRKDGTLFHIDYGFVFGADSISSVIRLDHNLIEGLGGVKRYEPFKNRCCEIFCCLRRHFNLICSCLIRLSSIQPPIVGYNFTSEFIEKFAIERFLLGLTEEESKDALSTIIDSNRETFFHKVSDAVHKTVSSFKINWWSGSH